MNEIEMTALLNRAGDALDPDVEALISRGALAGRRTRNLRRVGGTLVAAAAVGAVAIGASLLPQGTGTAPDRTTVAGPAAGPSGSAGPELADIETVKERLLDALPEGRVTDVEVAEKTTKDGYGRPINRSTIELRLDGRLVTAELQSWSRLQATDVPRPGRRPADCDPDDSPASPAGTLTRADDLNKIDPCSAWAVDRDRWNCAQDADCWAQAQQQLTCEDIAPPCETLADGTLLRRFRDAKNGQPGLTRGSAVRSSNAPWDIDLSAWNAADASSTPTGAPLALTMDQLAALVSSEIWFE